MYDDQQHLLMPIASALRDAFNKRMDGLIYEEARARGFGPNLAEKYRVERIATLKHYNDEAMLRLAARLSEQIVMRCITHAPLIIGTSRKKDDDNDI